MYSEIQIIYVWLKEHYTITINIVKGTLYNNILCMYISREKFM